jgi:NAD(P)-dependent dehydrogenase (short-subunit alcohol dehydrogenase family)
VASLRLKPLAEQVVVITGASSGIGLATARLAARRGAAIVAAARSRQALDELALEIRSTGGRIATVVADVSVEAEVQLIADRAIAAFGRVDTWVNNAAVSVYGRALDVSTADLRRIMEVNFWGVVYGSRVACDVMQPAGGALINLGSILSQQAAPLQGIYSASKHAIKGWTEALRMELGHQGVPISVTLIEPAAIGTPYSEHALNYLRDQPTHIPPVYSPRSVADAILFAASHPVPMLTVGAAGKALTMLSRLAPRTAERVLSPLLHRGMHSGRPRHGRPAAWQPSEDLRERGDYPGLVRPSLATALRTRPAVRRLLLTVVPISLVLLATRR